MGSEEKPMVDCGLAAASPTVEELISQLRSSFFGTEFQNVTKTLMEREEHMKEKCIELGKKSEAVEKEKDLLLLENLKLNVELKKKQKEIDAFRKENLEYKDQIKVLNLEKCRVSEKLALEDELKKKQSEIDAMRKLNAELRAYKTNFLDLDDRVLSLEKTAKVLRETSSISLENESSRPPSFGEKGNSNKRTEPKFQEIIQIDDDDDLECISTLKRKYTSNEIKRECNGFYVDNIPTGTQKRKNLQELHNQPIASHPVGIRPCLEKPEPKAPLFSLDSPDYSSGPDNENIDEAYESRMKMQKERWEFKADMIKEFDKDGELCMNAICALHRQIIKGKLSSFGTHILPAYDISRITKLMELLTDGDPQRKLKKTASELTRSDLDDCRKFAKRYSDQLFNIYQKKDDPFFLPKS